MLKTLQVSPIKTTFKNKNNAEQYPSQKSLRKYLLRFTVISCLLKVSNDVQSTTLSGSLFHIGISRMAKKFFLHRFIRHLKFKFVTSGTMGGICQFK